MIFTEEGHPVSQESIVLQNFGRLIDAPGGDFLAFEGRLNRNYKDDNGDVFRARATRIMTPAQAVAALREGLPLLYTTAHHATVQTDLTYQVVPGGPIVVKGGRIWDPAPGVGWRVLNAQDVQTFVAAWAIRTQTTREPATASSSERQTDYTADARRPSADKDQTLNELIDAINDLPIVERSSKGSVYLRMKHQAQLAEDCVLELNASRDWLRDRRRDTYRQVLRLANSIVDLVPNINVPVLRFRAKSTVDGELFLRASLSVSTTEEARRVRDLAQAAIRECSR